MIQNVTCQVTQSGMPNVVTVGADITAPSGSTLVAPPTATVKNASGQVVGGPTTMSLVSGTTNHYAVSLGVAPGGAPYSAVVSATWQTQPFTETASS